MIVSRITAFSSRRASTCRRSSSTSSPAVGTGPAGASRRVSSVHQSQYPLAPVVAHPLVHARQRATRVVRHAGERLAAQRASGRVRLALQRIRTPACARVARVLANPFRQRPLGRVAELGDDLPDGHALHEMQVNGPAPILPQKHAGSNPGAQTSNSSSAPLPL